MQSSKDSKGGKSHANQKSGANHGKSAAAGEKKSKPNSPTGAHNHSEKKTRP